MKKLTILFLITCIIGCKERSNLQSGLEGKPLPSFNYLSSDSITFVNTSKIPVGKPIVFFYFSPHCPYCRSQTQDILNNNGSLRDIQFILLTPYSYHELKEFYKHYNLEQYPNITVGIDYDNSFSEYFNTHKVPYLAVYSKNRILKQVSLGEMKSNEIKKVAFD